MADGRGMRRSDRAAAAVLVGLAVLALAWLIPAYTAPAQSPLDLPPALIPSVTMAVVLAMALLLLWTRRRTAEAPEEEHEEFGDEASGLGRRELVNLALWLALSAVTFLLLDTLGFVAAGALLVAATMWHARQRNPWLLVGLPLALPLALQWIVWHAFTVILP